MAMNSTIEILSAFRQLTGCCYNIWNWEYDPELNIIESDCPNELLMHNLFMSCEGKEEIEKHMENSRLPFIYSTSVMLAWIVAFEASQDGGTNIHVKGPFFSGYNDQESYHVLVNEMGLTTVTEKVLLDTLKSLPTLTASSILQFSLMLHYCLTNETLEIEDIKLINVPKKAKKGTVKVWSDQFERGSRFGNIEQELLEGVRNGDLSIDQVSNRARKFMSGMYEGDKKGIYYYKQKIHILLTLVSRAAAEGGLSRKTALTLCADYRRTLETCISINDITSLSRDLLLDYVYRVRETKKISDCSRQIRMCCDYIERHLNEELALDTLAKEVGYSEHHLSRKFKQEMGSTIVEYIKQVRLKRAEYLLTTTDLNMETITIEIGFGSRSYFTHLFKKHTGVTPREYRKNNSISV